MIYLSSLLKNLLNYFKTKHRAQKSPSRIRQHIEVASYSEVNIRLRTKMNLGSDVRSAIRIILLELNKVILFLYCLFQIM